MNSPSRRSCRYRQPPTTWLVSRKQPSPKNNDAQSTSGASRWSIRSSSTWATIKKHRFSGVKRDKQPSASSFAAAVKHQAGKDDDASTATINVMEPLLGVTESRPIKKMMRSSPFTYKTGSSSTSMLSFKIGKGRMAASLTREASIQERCRRWKPMSSKKPVRIPSNVVLRMTKQTFSYDAFSSSRGSPSPPPQHVESPAAANSVELNSAIFVEYAFDFDENFIGDLTVPNHFRSLDATEHEVDPKSSLVSEEQSTESSESNPSPRNLHPRHPPEQHFIPPFNPIPTLDETLDDGADDRDLEHVLSASAGIKFFESLQKATSSNSSFVSVKSASSYSAFKSPSSCGSWKPPNYGSLKSPSSRCAFKSHERTSFESPRSSGFRLPSCYGGDESVEKSIFQLPNRCKINECKDGDTLSQCSMPSISDTSSKNDHRQVATQQEAASDKDLSDAVIAWTLLGAVMGSPAPQPVLGAQKRRRCNEFSNLWIGDNTMNRLNDDVINMDEFDDLGDAPTPCPPSGTEASPVKISRPDECVTTLEQRFNLLAHLSMADENCDSNDSSSIPDVGKDGLIDPVLDGKVDPALNLGLIDTVDVSSSADKSDNDSLLEFYEDNFSTKSLAVPPDSEEVANAAIAWGALAALLGSPAPSCVPQKKERSPAINLWVDCTAVDDDDEIISLPCSDIDDSSEGTILAAVSKDEELTEELSLTGLQLDSKNTSTVRKDEDNASTVLAWSALAALLGSPAPSCVLQKQSRSVENLWADAATIKDDELISLPCSEGSFVDDYDEIEPEFFSCQIDHESVGDLSLSALQLEACDSCERTDMKMTSQKKDEITNSAIAWSALTALLGLPAPSCVLQKKSREVKNFWTADDGSLNDDLISLAPSEDPHDGEIVAHCADALSRGCEFIDDLSLSALQVDSDDIHEVMEESPFAQTKNDITSPTIAWGALTALLGLPAPSCVLNKSNRPIKNLWAGDVDDNDDGLVSLDHSQGSCLDDSDSVPSLVAESQVGSYPSSPSIHNVSSSESVSPSKENNTVIDSLIEWTRS